MRIGLFTGVFPAVSETFVYDQAVGLMRSGHDVFVHAVTSNFDAHLLPPAVRSLLESRTYACYKGERTRARALRLLAVGTGKAILAGVGRRLAAQILRDRGTYRQVCKNLVDVGAYGSHMDYDILIGHFGPHALRAAQFLRLGLGDGKLVSCFHGCDVSSLTKYDSYRKALPRLFQSSVAVVAVSSWVRRRLLDLGCPGDKIHTIPCGANLSLIRRSTAVRSTPCRFLAVCRLAPGKGPIMTLKAFNYTRKVCPDVSLTIIGDGELFGQCRDYIRMHKLEDWVRLLGACPHAVVVDELANASVFLQHSRRTPDGWEEAWGITLDEAGGAGLPVVATRTGGIADHVFDGENGFLVEDGDWQAMGEAMVGLARDSSRRARMGAKARLLASQNGNAEKQQQKLLSILQSVLRTDGETA